MKTKNFRQKKNEKINQIRNKNISNIIYEFMIKKMFLKTTINVSVTLFYKINTYKILMFISNYYIKIFDFIFRILILIFFSILIFYHCQYFSFLILSFSLLFSLFNYTFY